MQRWWPAEEVSTGRCNLSMTVTTEGYTRVQRMTDEGGWEWAGEGWQLTAEEWENVRSFRSHFDVNQEPICSSVGGSDKEVSLHKDRSLSSKDNSDPDLMAEQASINDNEMPELGEEDEATQNISPSPTPLSTIAPPMPARSPSRPSIIQQEAELDGCQMSLAKLLDESRPKITVQGAEMDFPEMDALLQEVIRDAVELRHRVQKAEKGRSEWATPGSSASIPKGCDGCQKQ